MGPREQAVLDKLKVKAETMGVQVKLSAEELDGTDEWENYLLCAYQRSGTLKGMHMRAKDPRNKRQLISLREPDASVMIHETAHAMHMRFAKSHYKRGRRDVLELVAERVTNIACRELGLPVNAWQDRLDKGYTEIEYCNGDFDRTVGLEAKILTEILAAVEN